MNMVEKVARALDLWPDPENYCSCASCKVSMERDKEVAIIKARAAIEAMRDPTDGQMNEYYKIRISVGDAHSAAVFNVSYYQSMIDAALKE